VFCRREEALRRKDLELQESLIKFNKFLQVGREGGDHYEIIEGWGGEEEEEE